MTKYQREISVAAAYLGLLVALAILAPEFYRGDQFQKILVSNAPVLVAAVGMSNITIEKTVQLRPPKVAMPNEYGMRKHAATNVATAPSRNLSAAEKP